MADGYQRTRARKKLKLPSGDTIYVPVLVKANVLDQNGQETELTIDSTATNQTRVLHVDDLHPTVPVDRDGNPAGGATLDHATTLEIERIDSWIGLDLISQAQDSEFSIDNTTGNDTAPPRFTTHQKTHIYRYFKDPNHPDDNGTFVDCELIDEISVIDQNGQEHIYFLLGNPTNDGFRGGDLSGQADPNDPDITIGDGSGEGATNNPIRCDPFQNIVNFSSQQPVFTLNMTASAAWASTGAATDTGISGADPAPDGALPVITVDQSFNNVWATNWSAATTSAGSQSGFGFGPGPSVSGTGSGSFGEFQYVGTGVNAGDQQAPETSGEGANIAIFGHVVGPPLIVDSKTIPGFAATLSITMGVYGFKFDAGPIIGDRVEPSTHTWWRFVTGYYTAGNEVQADSFSITVSSSSFSFHSSNWKAVGLKSGLYDGGNLQIYCVPA